VNCIDITNCIDFNKTPRILTSGYIGSRKRQTRFYWDSDKMQIQCGCFVGDLNKFEQAVKEKHETSSPYYVEYMDFIKECKFLITKS
jgi:hypothetical protein